MKKNSLFLYFQRDKFDFAAFDLYYLDSEVVDLYYFVHFRKATIVIENKSGNCLIVVRLGQIESEHLVDAFDLETGRKEVGVILGLLCDIFVGVVLVFDFPEEFLYDVF